MAVIGVLFKVGDHNDWMEKVLSVIPDNESGNATVVAIDPYQFIPEETLSSYYVSFNNFLLLFLLFSFLFFFLFFVFLIFI